MTREMVERLTPEQRQAFMKACQPGLFEYDEVTTVLRVSERAPLILRNMDDLHNVGMLHTKGDDNLVSATVIPERYWFKVEVRRNGGSCPSVSVCVCVCVLLSR